MGNVLQMLMLVAMAAVALADKPYASTRSAVISDANYGFDWAVRDSDSGNNFGQEETRDGDNTQGSYFVHLPDGRLQTVNYYVTGDSGFVADVNYDGEARYDVSFESRETPRFTAPTRTRTPAPARTRTPAPARPRSSSPARPRSSSPARPRSSSPTRPSSSSPARPSFSSHFTPRASASAQPIRNRFFSAESFEIRSPFFRDTDERSLERFDSRSFERSREKPDSFESHEFFKVPKNPFIRDTNESF
ncbi:hypothetical protein Pcinc_024440 [Petrolisthes cinctipes]|uniref:Pro-resilin n=1 Tax=Petrolisthes cinctipes TaxID=88211 RepID=A0AAE1KFB1_PETCI|nr:hypothetical protein Pcinc_024440 [Petrolisthes cinctipes]